MIGISADVKDGAAFTGYWLTRAAELVRRQGDAFLVAHGVSAPSQCVSMMLTLDTEGPLGVTEIARRLGISHQLARQRLQALLGEKFARERRDKTDLRKRHVALTPKGRREVALLSETFVHAEHAFVTLFDEIGVDVIRALKNLEAALLTSSILDRSESGSDARSDEVA